MISYPLITGQLGCFNWEKKRNGLENVAAESPVASSLISQTNLDNL